MTESAYSIFKRPDTIENVEPFLEVFYGIPGAGHYTPNLAQEINLSRIQRCFNQFDRKTDCFVSTLSVGLYNPFQRRRPERVLSFLAGQESSGRRTRKAVCGTQTRMPEGFNLRSQIMRLVAVGGGCAHEAIESDHGIKRCNAVKGGSMPSQARLIWQKSRRVRPLNNDSGGSQQYNGFRPDRTGLRKTPSSWLPANEISKDHPGFVLKDMKVKESPFLSRGL